MTHANERNAMMLCFCTEDEQSRRSQAHPSVVLCSLAKASLSRRPSLFSNTSSVLLVLEFERSASPASVPRHTPGGSNTFVGEGRIRQQSLWHHGEMSQSTCVHEQQRRW
jgi:hypothetical protein